MAEIIDSKNSVTEFLENEDEQSFKQTFKDLRENMRKMSLCEYFDWYLINVKKRNVVFVTYQKYEMASKWLKENVSDLMLVDLEETPMVLQQMLDMYGKTRQRQTVFDFKRHLLAALIYARDNGFLARLPKHGLEIHSVEDSWSTEQKQAHRNKPKTLSSSECKEIKSRIDYKLEELTNFDKVPVKPKGRQGNRSNSNVKSMSLQAKLMLFAILLHTGCRFAEGLGLTIDDIHDDYIDINKTLEYKRKTYEFADTKNKSSIRKVYVDKKIIKLIRRYDEWRHMWLGPEALKPLVLEADAPIYNDTLNHQFVRLQNEYGITKNISMHKIRHTYISYSLMKGIPAMFIADQVGHSTTDQIVHTYGHLIDEQKKESISKVQQILE